MEKVVVYQFSYGYVKAATNNESDKVHSLIPSLSTLSLTWEFTEMQPNAIFILYM